MLNDRPDIEPTDAGHRDSPDVRVVRRGEREILIVGTAHVSRESADLVRDVIERERPDHVCVELDRQRLEALAQQKRWEALDLREVIRRKQLATLVTNLLLASYQRRLGEKLGVTPGTELLEAVRVAEANDIPFSLCDRDVRVTMLRAWRSMSFFQRSKMLSGLLAGLFVGEELTEEQLRELRRGDALSEMMEELARGMPTLKRVLIDERDAYLAEKIRAAPGGRVVAVVGAGHVEGIVELLERGAETDLSPIEVVPPMSPVWKWIGWAIPALIVGSLVAIGWTQGGEVAGRNLRYWVLANSIPSGLGALLALAHPLTVVSAMVAAPITSLTPVIGAGYVTAAVQAYLVPPRVRDFHTLTEDAGTLGRWWSNRLLRVLLAFVFPALGSIVGTYLGGYEIVSNLF